MMIKTPFSFLRRALSTKGATASQNNKPSVVVLGSGWGGFNFATELNKDSVSLAQANLAANGVDNVKVARLSAEDVAQALDGIRTFSRLAEAGLSDLRTSHRFSTLLVDPPRAGMDEACVELARRFHRIVYISCSPETLARDVAALRATHTIDRLAAFVRPLISIFPFALVLAALSQPRFPC